MEAGTPDLIKLEDLEVSSGLTGRKHILSLLVENKPGVLARIAGLFSRRGFNIDTLAVGPTEDPDISRITLTVDGALHPIDQVTKQLHKLVNVIKIRDMEPEQTIAREMALFRVSAAVESRGEIMQFADIFRGRRDRRLAAHADDRDHGRHRQDRGLRAHGAPPRAGRDGAHRRGRDHALPPRGVAWSRAPTATSGRESSSALADGLLAEALATRAPHAGQRHDAGRGAGSERDGVRLAARRRSLVLLGAAGPRRVRARRDRQRRTRSCRAGTVASPTSRRDCAEMSRERLARRARRPARRRRARCGSAGFAFAPDGGGVAAVVLASAGAAGDARAVAARARRADAT